MKRKRRRKCKSCGTFYQPDHRTRDRQRYCSQPACRQRSHAQSQRRWLAKPANRDYFHGQEHLQRMRLWRAEHPNYRKSRSLEVTVVNDDCPPQPLVPQRDQLDLAGIVLQDDCPSQLPVIVGLISNLTGQVSQDDIASTLRQLHSRGQQILGGAATTAAPFLQSPTTGGRNVAQTTIVPRAAAAGAAAIQLDRSATGPP